MMAMVDSFLDELRRPRPDPGGGAAAAHGALLGIALAEKIVQLEWKRAAGTDAELEPREGHLREVSRLTLLFTRLRSEDVEAYRILAEVLRSGDGGIRLHDALVAAVRCPMEIMREARGALDLIEDVGSGCRRFLVADVLVACEFLGLAVRSAYHIAIANLPLMEDLSSRGMWLAELTRERDHGIRRLDAARAALEVRNAAGGR
jgi:formiminotetrahydrofolate cyclodeaminase